MAERRKLLKSDALTTAERASLRGEARRLAADEDFWRRADDLVDKVAAGEIQTEPLDTEALKRPLEAQRKVG